MANTIIVKDLLQKETIRLLDKNMVIAPMANRKYEFTGASGILSQGDTVSVQTFPDIEFRLGGTAGASISETNFTITSEDLEINKVAQVNVPITDIEEIQSNIDLRSKVANRFAFRMGQIYDKFVAATTVDGANANNVIDKASPVTLTSGDIYAKVEEMRTKLSANNAFGNAALFVDPTEASLIRQSGLFDGFNEGLRYRVSSGVATMNGLFGQMAGFDLYETNNLPHRQKLTIASAPSNGQTFTITDGTDTLTFTAVTTIGTTAGNVLIGGSAAAFQTNLKTLFDAIGTTTTTGVALSAADQLIFNRWQLRLGTWASDVNYLSANLSFTAGGTATNIVKGDLARVMFAMDRESVNFVEQMNKMKITDATDAFKSNMLVEMVYGAKVFTENAKRITTVDVAV